MALQLKISDKHKNQIVDKFKAPFNNLSTNEIIDMTFYPSKTIEKIKIGAVDASKESLKIYWYVPTGIVAALIGIGFVIGKKVK